jgi:hypothetical protein
MVARAGPKLLMLSFFKVDALMAVTGSVLRTGLKAKS